MILTYKIKHFRDFSDELRKAKKIANYAIQTHSLSSKDVKHFGLKSMISNQILRKYSRSHTAKSVKSVKLAVPKQGIKVDRDTKTISAPCLKLSLRYDFPDNFEKVNQIEIGSEYAYVSVSVPEPEQIKAEKWIGVDRNTVGHIAVVADPESGKVIKLGKSALHIHQNTRTFAQATRPSVNKAGKRASDHRRRG